MRLMNFPTYTLDTVKGQMTYGYNRKFRKWAFQVGTNIQLVACHGNEQGHKVASIIAGSLKRSEKVDGMAYANINKVLGR